MSTDAYFKSFMCRYEIVCLFETWTTKQNYLCNLLTDVECFILHGYRKGSRGHNNGGVSVYVNSKLLKLCKRINVTNSLGIFILLSGTVLSISARILLVSVYLPPEGSCFYTDKINGILMLEAEIANVLATLDGDIYIILTDHLNARTRNQMDFLCRLCKQNPIQ